MNTHNARTYQAYVQSVEDRGPDTRILKLALEHGHRLSFLPGQYVSLQAPDSADGEARYFSIASAPAAEYLEFHIRNAGQGISAWLATSANPGNTITLSGPFGKNIWQTEDRPALALAGGIGIAPIKSMIEAHLDSAATTPFTLYWGVRDKDQLYLDNVFRTLATRHKRFSYIPVVMNGGAEDGPHRHGLIGPAVIEDMESLSGYDIYMAGPKAMIDATLPLLEDLNAEKERIFCDAFSV